MLIHSLANLRGGVTIDKYMSKNAKITLLILILIVVFGSLIFYYSLQSKSPPDLPLPLSLTEEQKSLQPQKDTAIAELKVRMATNPPITKAQRDKALLDLKNRMQ